MAARQINRRSFLSFCTSALLAVIAILVAVPAVGYLFAPLRRRLKGSTGTSYENLGPLDNITPSKANQSTWILLPIDVVTQDGWDKVREHHSVYVRCDGDSKTQVSVLSPICTHLGCPVNWDQKDQQFHCPCHGGVYDANGKHIGGPPPRGLDPLPFKVEDGRLEVEWVDYKVGVPERVPVQV